MTISDSLKTVHRWSGQTRPRIDAEDASINFVFDAAGAPLVAGGRCNVKVGLNGRIVRAHILADVAPIIAPFATADFVLLHGSYDLYPNLLPIYTLPTQAPALLFTDVYKAECSLLGWNTRLSITDTLICVLTSVTGGITSVTLALTVRKIVHP